MRAAVQAIAGVELNITEKPHTAMKEHTNRRISSTAAGIAGCAKACGERLLIHATPQAAKVAINSTAKA